MKLLMLLFLMVVLVSCSSVKTGDEETDKVVAHLSKEPVLIGKDFDAKFLKDGLINGEYLSIGNAIHKGGHNGFEGVLRVKAEASATSRLLNSAPTTYKKIVQRAINTVNGDDGEVQESDIRVTEVRALTGLTSNFDDTQCVKRMLPTQDLKYEIIKECRVLVRVPAVNLLRAYDYTLDVKYKIKKDSAVQDILKKELEAVDPAPTEPTVSNN